MLGYRCSSLCRNIAALLLHLTAEQSARLERVQKRILKIVSKRAEMLYEELLTKFKVQTLEERREKLCKDFGRKYLIHPIHNKTTPAQVYRVC